MKNIDEWLKDIQAIKTWGYTEEGLEDYNKDIKNYLNLLNEGKVQIDSKIYSEKNPVPAIILVISTKNNTSNKGMVVGILKIKDKGQVDVGNVLYFSNPISENKENWNGVELRATYRNRLIDSGDNDFNKLKEAIKSAVTNNLVGRKTMKNNITEFIGSVIEKNKQVIFTGAPGTGKTYSVREYVKQKCAILDEAGNEQFDKDDELITDEKQYKFVQFHPSYDYSDFVEGLRPAVLKGNTGTTFVRMDGVFKAFCRHIVEENKKENKKNYYFIVDEINRADLAKVFGELMFGLEESYRGERYKFDTQYKNLITYRIIHKNDSADTNKNDIGKAIPIEDDVFKDGFYIPENLYFIGTMNDIDRSVDSMDFALRRRFQWIDIKANEIMKSSLHSILDKDNTDENSENYKKIDALAGRIIAMNKIISENNKFGLSEAYHIGPAYFKNLDINNDNSLRDIFDTNIVSILREYTRGRKSEEVNNWIRVCREALVGEY